MKSISYRVGGEETSRTKAGPVRRENSQMVHMVQVYQSVNYCNGLSDCGFDVPAAGPIPGISLDLDCQELSSSCSDILVHIVLMGQTHNFIY